MATDNALGEGVRSPLADEKLKFLKDIVKQEKSNHELHVLLIMRELKASKPDATVLAYWEGPDGLDKRLK